jgi:disulfide bond formation protein DsbB
VRVYQFRHTGTGVSISADTALGKMKIGGLASTSKIGKLPVARVRLRGYMHQALPLKRNWSERFGLTPAMAAAAIFVLSFATLGGAWYFQFVLGYQPCHLCLIQRIPYYIVIPLSFALAIAARYDAPRPLVAGGLAVLAAAALISATLGAYHAGIEWGFWPGPSDCTGPLSKLNSGGSLIDQLNAIHVVPCDKAAWRLLGISLAGYNVLISLVLAGIAGCGLLARPHRIGRVV